MLFVMLDQMRGDCLGLEGHPTLLTPNMDEVGAKGAFFQRAYTTCASCVPARRSFLTGLHPSNTGFAGPRQRVPIPPETPTLPQMLRDAGYATVMVGRTMHQYPNDESYGYEKVIGASTYVEDDDYGRMLREKAPESGGVKGHGMSFNGWTAKPFHLPEYLHPTNYIVQQARNVIHQHASDKPLFLTASFYAPHPPFIPPAFYMERYLRTESPPPVIGSWACPPENDGIGAGIDSSRVHLRGEALRSAQAGYYGLINHLDDQLFYLLWDFKHRSGKRPWVIIITSDHGEMLGDHYLFRKCEPYEGSSRIPLLIQGSQNLGLQTGFRSQQPVCLEDIMPTVLELAQIPQPEGLDGRSLVPLMRGETNSVRPYLHAEHAPHYTHEQGYHMLTDGRFKYIWRPYNGKEQLFDLAEDPYELNDLAPEESFQTELGLWRSRMVEELKDRPEGFSDGRSLLPGRRYTAGSPQSS